MERILVINPGMTSTKYAVYDGEEAILKTNLEHQADELKGFERIADQHEYRLKLITDALAAAGIELKSLSAVVGRGGLIKCMPSGKGVPSGTTATNEDLVKDLTKAELGEHASNLGGLIAHALGKKLGIPSFIVDPVTVDELIPEARISGHPDFTRTSMTHALNQKAVARKVAAEIGKNYTDCNFVTAHMGSGGSLTIQSGGRIIDMSNGWDEGPFSPVRAGGVPSFQLIKMCYSGKVTLDELKKKLTRQGGFSAYMGTEDVRIVEKMANEGDEKADLILKAFVHQNAKEIGALATVVAGKVDRIILTGGLAYSKRLTGEIIAKVQHIAPVVVVPGEEEMGALAGGGLRVLRGEEKANEYK